MTVPPPPSRYQITPAAPVRPDYFSGVTAIGSGFSDIAFGMGNSPHDAYQAALDHLDEQGVDTARMPIKPRGIRKADGLSEPQQDAGYQFAVAIYFTPKREKQPLPQHPINTLNSSYGCR